MLKNHNRYPYVPITQRQPYDWPDGSRLAVFVAINVEQFPFGEGMGVALAPVQPEPDIVNFSWRDYGNRVGFWRILELLDEFEFPATMALNSEILDHCPQILTAIEQRGDEVVAHGRTNAERQGEMAEADERALIDEVTETLGKKLAKPPAGWMGPWLSQSAITPDLLQEAGYQYVLDWGSDDQPFWLKTRKGRILSVPHARPTNDLSIMHGRDLTPAQYADILIDQFDEMRLQSKRQPLVFGLSLHPYLIGHAFALRHLRRCFAHFAAHDDIWITTTGAIAQHAASLPEGLVV
jgi:hypothetical protein